MSLTQYNVIPIQWLRFAIICTFSLHHTITEKRKRKILALHSKNPARRGWSSLFVNKRLDFHDQCQSLQMPTYYCPNRTNNTELDQNVFPRWRPPLDWAALVESRSWTWSLLALGGGAVSTWLQLAALGLLVTLANLALAFDQNWLVDRVWQRQYGSGLVDRKQDLPGKDFLPVHNSLC